MTKRKGDKGSPCLMPLEGLRLPHGVPLIRNESLKVEMHS